MITCLCPGDDRETDLNAAIEIPWCAQTAPHECWAAGPHGHCCYRPTGHTGRHAEAEDLVAFDGGARARIVTAVWSD